MQTKIEKLSSELYVQSTAHRFKKEKNSFDRGYLKVNFWMDELCLESITKDRQIALEFDEKVGKLKRWMETIKESEYKRGMLQALKDAGYL